MLRNLIIAAGFVIVTLALILLQPNARPRDETLARHAPVAAPPKPAGEVTRIGSDMLRDAVALSVPNAQAAPQNDEMQALTNGVLADLGIVPAQAPEDDAMRALTEGVLASLGNAQMPKDLEGLIALSMQSNEANGYLDALITEAVGSGRLAVGGAMVTAGGDVDSRMVLAAIVEQAQNGPLGAGSPETIAMKPVPRPELDQAQTYVVQNGDSLAGISYRFYGKTSEFTKIYNANRHVLSGPDQISVGQRLVIPAG